MRIYTAGPWKEREWVKEQAQKLRDAGHTVDCRWLTQEEADEGGDGTQLDLRQYALNDLEDVDKADTLIYYNTGVKSEGKATELGYAIASLKRIVLVGERTNNIFLHLNIPSFPNTEGAIEYLAWQE